jgi:hypothetical protein
LGIVLRMSLLMTLNPRNRAFRVVFQPLDRSHAPCVEVALRCQRCRSHRTYVTLY